MTKQKKILLSYLLKEYKQSLKQYESKTDSFQKDALEFGATMFAAFAKRITNELSFLKKFGFTCNVEGKAKEYRFAVRSSLGGLAKEFGVNPKNNHQVLDIQFTLDFLKKHYFKVGRAYYNNGISVEFEFPGPVSGGWDLQVIDEKTLKQMKEQLQKHMKNCIWSIINKVRENYKQLEDMKR